MFIPLRLYTTQHYIAQCKRSYPSRCWSAQPRITASTSGLTVGETVQGSGRDISSNRVMGIPVSARCEQLRVQDVTAVTAVWMRRIALDGGAYW